VQAINFTILNFRCKCPIGFSGNNCQTNDEDCTTSSCLNGGTCLDGINNYTCICQKGFTGANCQTKISPCNGDPCINGGNCIPNDTSFSCICPEGLTGRHCEKIIDWCSDSPCQNDAKCFQQGKTFRCQCLQGWSGKVCDVREVSCEVSASLQNVPLEKLCSNNGHCLNKGDTHECICKTGFKGSYCQSEVNECSLNPCQNGATCQDLVNTYYCTCPQGFQGKNCEFNINNCDPSPCKNGGTCSDMENGFQCSCPFGTQGQLCEINVDDCLENPCYHGGTCVDKVGGYECICKPGYVGNRCEGDVNECLSKPCSHQGTQECLQLVNDFNCVCKPGWMGKYCETRRNFCHHNPCQNGGVCANSDFTHECICPTGYSGMNCEFFGSSCTHNLCQNGGTCQEVGSDFVCLCPAGTTGRKCEEDTRNECSYNPCKQGKCIDKIGNYDCYCEKGFKGKNCDIEAPSSPGGIDKQSADINVYIENQRCIDNKCSLKSGNNKCDEECNTHYCNYDGGDCRLGLNPWKFCNATTQNGRNCWEVFRDDHCDLACNTKECLFDGYDCEDKQLPCDKLYDAYCTDHYGNGICDENCNSEACGWDGLDCERKKERHKIIPGSFYVVLAVNKDGFDEEKQKRFVRYMSLMMRSNFKISKDSSGQAMIFDYNPGGQMEDVGYAFNTNLILQAKLGIVVYLEIDNVKCNFEELDEHCFNDVEDYANYFSAMMGKSQEPTDDWGIVQVGYAKGDSPGSGSSSKDTYGVIIGLVIVALIVVTIGVIVQTNKKRARGITWFPDGFSQPLKQRKLDGQGFGFGNMSMISSNTNIDGWSDDDPQEQEHISKKKKLDIPLGQTVITDNNDGRQWTQHHLNAAGQSGMLTPPQTVDMIMNDVDVRGPMGMTPLMIAATRGLSGCYAEIDNENFEEDEATAAVIQDLISQDADINAQMDKTGETPLHLAARYRRADAAKLLIDAGADVNAQDHSGRTPLHSSVSTDAQGVFHILLKNRATNLNAKTGDGTTPLILAARLGIEGMVEQLIEAEADVNSADEQGKTALHWAAAVNNVEAAGILLVHGANRDAQDNKDETPLFLAAREGSYQAARVLLDHCANRDIQDHMDRLPLHVAHERAHQDIVTLLEEHIPPALPMSSTLHTLALTNSQNISSLNNHQSSNSHQNQSNLPGSKPSRGKKRGKANSPPLGNNDDFDLMGGHTLPRNGAKNSRKRMSDKSLTPVGQHLQNQYSSHLTLSQPNFEDLLSGMKQPPSYEAAVNGQHNNRTLPRDDLPQQMGGFKYLSTVNESHMQQQAKHHQQQSVPTGYTNHLSPPHSNVSNQMQSPPPLGNNLSPSNHGIMMSPPQSVHSNHTMSPPLHNSQMLSPTRQHQSPSKTGRYTIMLPTSPTNPLGLNGSAKDFCTDPNFASSQYMTNHSQFIYPNMNPTGTSKMDSSTNFMTPSPDSPGQWSPPSHPDWSDGVHNQYQGPQQNISKHHHLVLMQKQQKTEGVLI